MRLSFPHCVLDLLRVDSKYPLRKHRFDPWVRKIPCRRKWQPTPVFLPGEFHGQRSLVGCSPWGHKRDLVTEQQDHRCSHHGYRKEDYVK